MLYLQNAFIDVKSYLRNLLGVPRTVKVDWVALVEVSLATAASKSLH